MHVVVNFPLARRIASAHAQHRSEFVWSGVRFFHRTIFARQKRGVQKNAAEDNGDGSGRDVGRQEGGECRSGQAECVREPACGSRIHVCAQPTLEVADAALTDRRRLGELGL